MKSDCPTLSKRIQQLTKLKKSIISHESEIYEALNLDFKKPIFETYITEFQYTINDINYTIKNLKRWSKPKYVLPTIINFPSVEYIHKEPYGRVLIIAPWNYPFQLALVPLVGAIAAGNSVVLKPSEIAYHTSLIITKIIEEVFVHHEAIVVHGDAGFTQNLLKQPWDYIFFTGSTKVGKIIAIAAAQQLTPITLELGGKNPCVIDETANIAVIAKRIVWSKFLNAGQTCVAPDFILVQAKEKYNLITALKKEIINFYGENSEDSNDFARIINDANWERLTKLINPKTLIFGGKTNQKTRFIAPTLLEISDYNDPIMQDEIFGPLLPILIYDEESELLPILKRFEKPLAFYVFSERKDFIQKLINTTSSGGVCVNDSISQLINHRLPFGGVGASGYGAYHGKTTFSTFSHQKSVVKRATWIDLPIKYAPYSKKIKWINMLMKRI
jgi:aldehyde dehydrogenase (NAD+)